MKAKKLTYRTQQVYLIFSVIVFITIIPIYFFISKIIYLDDVDESLFKEKYRFENVYLPQLTIRDTAQWNKLHHNIKILNITGVSSDSVYSISYYNKNEKEMEPFRELIAPILIEGKPFALSVKTNLLESEDLMISIALLVFSLLAILLFGLYLISKKQYLILWKPFYKTLTEIGSYDIDKNKMPILPASNIVEFNTLNEELIKLIRRNIQIFHSQKEFIENAAHELQTPIAVFKTKLDTLIQNPDLTEEQAKIIVLLNSTADRLQRINKNLLLISKIENYRDSEEKEFLINDKIEQSLKFFREQSLNRNIKIDIPANEVIMVKANAELFEIMLNNLLMNSVRHNIQNGKVTIELINQELIISNTGIDKALPNEKLFKRFSKSNSTKEGTGLGLSIVKKIADLNNWSVRYYFRNNLHHFSVSF